MTMEALEVYKVQKVNLRPSNLFLKMKTERFQTFFKAHEVKDLSTTLNSVRAICLQRYPRNNHNIIAEFEAQSRARSYKRKGGYHVECLFNQP